MEPPRQAQHSLSRRRLLIWTIAGGAFLADGTIWAVYLATRSRESTSPLVSYTGHQQGIGPLGWSPDGTRIASGARDGSVQVWEAATGHHILTYSGHLGALTALGWSPDGTRIASAAYHYMPGQDYTPSTYDISVHVWDAATGQVIMVYHHPQAGEWVPRVAWSPDGRRIASSGSSDNSVHIWEAATGKLVRRYLGHTSEVNALAWSPDGTRIASGAVYSTAQDAQVQVWESDTGQRLLTYRGHPDTVWAVAWSPDGTRIASCSSRQPILFADNGGIQIWEAATGQRVVTYWGHGKDTENFAVAWSPDGTHIASGSSDKTAQIWEAATGNHVLTYRGHSSAVFDLAWSPDSSRVVSADGLDDAQVWAAR